MTRAYVLAILERATKTACQSALLVLGADQINAMHASWGDVGGFALGGFILSVLTSVATSGFGGGDGPSLTTEHVAPQSAKADVTLDEQYRRLARHDTLLAEKLGRAVGDEINRAARRGRRDTSA